MVSNSMLHEYQGTGMTRVLSPTFTPAPLYYYYYMNYAVSIPTPLERCILHARQTFAELIGPLFS